jgi:hypothetical protein
MKRAFFFTLLCLSLSLEARPIQHPTVIPSIIKNSEPPQLKVYPNTDKSSTVEAKRIPGRLWVNLYNQQGRLLRSFRTKQHRFFLEHRSLPPGRYLLKANNKKGDSASVEFLMK